MLFQHSATTRVIQIATKETQRKHKQIEAFFSSSLIFVCYLYINNIWWLHQYDDLRFFDVLIGKLKLTTIVEDEF